MSTRLISRNGSSAGINLPKFMLLLFLDDVSSERELLRVTAMRIDYRWFLGYDLSDAVLHHSVLSRRGASGSVEVFQGLFERVVTTISERCGYDMKGSIREGGAVSKSKIVYG